MKCPLYALIASLKMEKISIVINTFLLEEERRSNVRRALPRTHLKATKQKFRNMTLLNHFEISL